MRLRPFRVHVRLGVHFCPTLAPFWHQKCPKIHQKGDKNNHRNFDRFSDRFGDDFSSLLGSILVPFGPLWHPKRSVFFNFFPHTRKNTPKVAQCPSKAPKMASTSDKMTSKSDPAAPNCRSPGGPKRIKNLQSDTLKRLPQSASLKLQGAAVIAVGVVDTC